MGELDNLVTHYYADEMKIIHEDEEGYKLTITIKDNLLSHKIAGYFHCDSQISFASEKNSMYPCSLA